VFVGEPEAVPAWEYASDVDVGFVGLDGVCRDGPLVRYWGEPFELASPARKFITFKGQKNFTGDFWAATSRDLVGYESWVERDAAMALDFIPPSSLWPLSASAWHGRMATGIVSTLRTTSPGCRTAPGWWSMSGPRASLMRMLPILRDPDVVGLGAQGPRRSQRVLANQPLQGRAPPAVRFPQQFLAVDLKDVEDDDMSG
jgi:hypothetical protein